MQVDLHAHAYPPSFLAALPPAAREMFSAWSLADLEARLDERGLTAAVLSVPPPGFAAAPAHAAREANEWMASLVAEQPDRYAALAALPLHSTDIDSTLAEIEHSLDHLALDGVSVFTNYGGRYLGDPLFAPVLAELDRRGAYVLVHPTPPPYALPVPEHPAWLYEFPTESTRAIADLVTSGTLRRFPRLRLQFPHLGGTALFLARRLASLAEREPALAGDSPEGMIASIGRLYFDTAQCNAVEPIAYAQSVVGPDRIGFGSDWPYAAEARDDDALALLSTRAETDLVPRLASRGGTS